MLVRRQTERPSTMASTATAALSCEGSHRATGKLVLPPRLAGEDEHAVAPSARDYVRLSHLHRRRAWQPTATPTRPFRSSMGKIFMNASTA